MVGQGVRNINSSMSEADSGAPEFSWIELKIIVHPTMLMY